MSHARVRMATENQQRVVQGESRWLRGAAHDVFSTGPAKPNKLQEGLIAMIALE
jgi:hypothetical protein